MNTTLENVDEIANLRKESLSMKLKSITFIAAFCSIGAALMGGMTMGWKLREIKNRLLSS